MDPLAGFSPPVREWFGNSFAEPTEAQTDAWRAITAGEHALVVAPTGSGKTLAAFLAALDDLVTDPPAPGDGCRVLYVSPLKALAVDVERNLRAPLRGISRAASRLGLTEPEVRVGVRSGDTSPTDRRRLQAKPPDILITTPESLFLMLTSAARETLAGVRTVILDEVHVLAGTKRGAHLALSLERLAELTERPFQRIGLSATVRPPERVAEFLCASAPVRLVLPASTKRWDLQVVVPVEDMADPGAGSDTAERRSMWPHLTDQILDEVLSHRSTIVFTNSRRIAERLTAQLNEAYAERLGEQVPREVASPASVIAQSGASKGFDGTDEQVPVIAKAHHGSVSKEQRAIVEDDLKSGRLRCVVATSSLELGIDMGAVDAVVQVESPPSVASGLQRVGRAGHQVGAISRGLFLPAHRGDLVETACVVDRMRTGLIEEVAELRNPLDVLAQQVVAICAGEEIAVSDLFTMVRRSAPFATLPRSAFDGVLDMLAGRYPSEEFAELRPRLTWDRERDVLIGRPGAQRLAVTSGGTIPDRGLFGVFLVGGDQGGGPGRRVGELDEEMVYESRVGDVFTLGTTAWRIEAITHDQVQVSPAGGQPGRLPFWKGDTPGRPLELGLAQGALVRELAGSSEAATDRLAEIGLDPRAGDNLVRYLAEQREATGAVPTDTTVVLERFRDELGDWQVCLHAGLGTPVLAPWALAIGHQARQRLGVEVHATATNDGIVIRVPDSDGAPPGAELVVIEPEEVESIVTHEVTGSALFASRFRECAARALLLPRRDPRARSPLWQQRMRAAQLLEVAAGHPDFPIVLETVRECLHDVFDLPGLLALQRKVAARQIRVVEVETPRASPMARSLLFGYVGEFVYEGDSPLAERRAAALTLDSGLLAELLGTDALRQVLDPAVIAEVTSELQWLAPHRRATSTEAVFDQLRTIGPLSAAEVVARCVDGVADAALAELQRQRRVVAVRIAGEERLAVVEDLPRLADALGVPAPPGFGVTTAEGEPLTDLVLRWARCHGPFTERELAARLGLGVAVVAAELRTMTARGTLVRGRFDSDAEGEQWCHHRVLGLIRRRTLAALRAAVEPVEQATFGRFLPAWQGVGGEARGIDGVAQALDQLAGAAVPASMLETMVLPARVSDYAPSMLDELLTAGEFSWTGDGAIGANDGWVRFWPADLAIPPADTADLSPLAGTLRERLERGGGWFFDDLVHADHSRADWEQALWELVWAGRARADTFAPVRARAASGAMRSTRTPRVRSRSWMLRASRRQLRVPAAPSTVGRWSATPTEPDAAERAATERLVLQLDRYGVLTRGSVLAEQPGGSFGPSYRALARLEESGQCLRGYFIDGLGAAQFATAATVDRLRDQGPVGTVVLAASDPANPYGAALSWPEREGHRPSRRAGSVVVLVEGRLVLHLERGVRTALTFGGDDPGRDLAAAAEGLAATIRSHRMPGCTVERADGEHIFDHPLRAALEAAGFTMTPQGLRLRS
ncbi:ATP-dependent helicase [Enemella dayhoffiae]|uniref:ATP-dependent helicase n=1 Tax=Enemella dayhoffiae TaxID=2016507 RepID=A0A255H4H6_9ACTN|nr:ATP-dependent helicase [Enemella dayhoffiae]OYO22053.1 ATP-dependent helicase [Enemella dayhoffiae]